MAIIVYYNCSRILMSLLLFSSSLFLDLTIFQSAPPPLIQSTLVNCSLPLMVILRVLS